MTVAAHLAAALRKGQLSARFAHAQKARPKVIDISGGEARPRTDVPGDPTQVRQPTDAHTCALCLCVLPARPYTPPC